MRGALLVAVVCVALLTGCVSSAVAPLPKPPKVSVLPTTTSIPDYSGTSLPSVEGTTTTIPISMSGGQATIHGRVLVAGAPVGGATVHIERFVDDTSVSTDVISATDGTYSLGNIQGGRYRVRAYQAPDLTMTQATVFFVGATDNYALDLNVTHFGGSTSVNAAVAPNPPILGQSMNLVVSVMTQGVDNSGTVRSIASPNLVLVLTTQSGHIITTPNPATTDTSGHAQWSLVCASLDSQALSVTLPDGSSYPLNVPACQLPPTTTTTTTTPGLQSTEPTSTSML